MPDLRLLVDDVAFAVRAVLICQRNGKLLVEAGDYPFRNLPGGAANTGEALAAGAAREWYEETGQPAGPLHLLALVENFFELKGRRWHELGFYYRIEAPDSLPDGRVRHADHDVNHLDWVDPRAEGETPIYPTSALSLLDEADAKFRHIINREGETVPGRDLRLDIQDTNFQLRVHLIYLQDGELLTNTVPGSVFWFLPGGSVLLGEDSLAAAYREFHEETGVQAKSARLVGLSEGFDRRTNRQQLGLCYRMEAAQPLSMNVYPVQDAESLELQWIPLGEVDSLPVHLLGLTKMLDVPDGIIEYSVIEWETV